MSYQVAKIEFSKTPAYFLQLADEWDVDKFPALWLIGDSGLLKAGLLALFCSRKCPGSVIRKSHDFAVQLRRKGVPVIGGFQTPVEKECLDVLLKGSQPVVVCPARGVEGMRLPEAWSKPIGEGKMLIVSPFSGRQRRPTKATAGLRNRFVAAAAQRLFFLHAAPNSRTLAFAEVLLSEGRDILTFDLKGNENLKSIGASCELVN